MELIRASCTNCGGILDINKEAKYGKCIYCGVEYVVENAKKLATIELDMTKNLQNNRLLLEESITNEDIKMIARYSGLIREIIPEDYSANYFYAYSLAKLGNPNYLYRFYDNVPQLCTKSENEKIINHIINHSELRDYRSVKGYINKNNFLDKNKYDSIFKQVFEERKKQEEHYDEVPRDVFICHSSKNVEDALIVLDVLEKDGNTCWISSRNLRPSDSENYWVNIERAIMNCQIFLVVSSMDAMLSKDVKKEMSMASLMGKHKLEYKIDINAHITFFKVFFDGYKWIMKNDFSILRQRVYEILEKNNVNLIKNKPTKTEEKIEIVKENIIKEKTNIKPIEEMKQVSLKNNQYVVSLKLIEIKKIIGDKNYQTIPIELLISLTPLEKLTKDVKITVSSLMRVKCHQKNNTNIKKHFNGNIINSDYLFKKNKEDIISQEKIVKINVRLLSDLKLSEISIDDSWVIESRQIEICMLTSQKTFFLQKMDKSEDIIILQ